MAVAPAAAGRVTAHYYALAGGAEHADQAHRDILAAVASGDAEHAVTLQDAHRARALERLRDVLTVA